MISKEYWNRNLDTDNLSRPGGATHAFLEESFAFARTPEFEWLRERLGNIQGMRMVELGGGIGMHALIWAREGARVLVVDIALERMKALRTLAARAGLGDRILFVVGQAEAIPLRDNTADLAFTKSVLIHTEIPRAARDIHRILKPGGRGAFIEPMRRNPIIRVYRRLCGPAIWMKITRYFDEQCFKELREPFDLFFWKPFYLLSAGSFFWQYGYRSLRRFQRSLPFWQRMDAKLTQWWPFLERWHWCAAIEVRKAGQPSQTERQAS
jgi:ubiquinone/menaquinone biosynthesis C-methylase UbiE